MILKETPTILNLVYPEKSEIRFKINQFQDGQQSVTLETGIPLYNATQVKIVSRLNNFKHLELILCAVAALRNNKVANVSLYVPYFIGARSDRQFTSGDSNYLKQVICPIINAQKFSSVTVLDPHSDVLEACLDNFEKINNHEIVKKALTNIDNRNDARERIVLVSPDAGAYKKIFRVAQKFDIDKIVTATKVRDRITGKIHHIEIPVLEQHKKLKYVIIDDICDSGGTSIELAKAIHGSRPTAEVYLVVTHGIFSNGFEEFEKEFQKIYFSNSYSDVTVDSHLLMQFNVFE